MEIRGDRAMRRLSVYKSCREPIAGFAHRQEKSSLTPLLCIVKKKVL